MLKSEKKYYDFPHHMKRRVFNNGGLSHMLLMEFFHSMKDIQSEELMEFPKFQGNTI